MGCCCQTAWQTQEIGEVDHTVRYQIEFGIEDRIILCFAKAPGKGQEAREAYVPVSVGIACQAGGGKLTCHLAETMLTSSGSDRRS